MNHQITGEPQRLAIGPTAAASSLTCLAALAFLVGATGNLGSLRAAEDSAGVALAGRNIQLRVDPASGLPAQIETRLGGSTRQWLSGPARMTVRNEVTSATAPARAAKADGAVSVVPPGPSLAGRLALAGSPLAAAQQWSQIGDAIEWQIDFRGAAKRVGHEVTIELPLLRPAAKVFTPTERGVMDVAAYPDFQGTPYAANGWDTGVSWVLPLVSVFDPQSDHALTIALPADANIPHLQFSWKDARSLRITLAHRGMGGDRPSRLSLLLFAHAADYRAAIRAYSDAFPRYFRPPLPRGPFEGAFWYHHIHEHPPADEMARQSVRYIWSSFWFTHLGEYLPDAEEWEPYTYAAWWKLRQTMSDEKIRSFVRAMHGRGIGTYAYFNVTEYGGIGGKAGDAAEAARRLREKFANALVKDAAGKDIPTWEGAMAMNPGGSYALWPFLEEQIRRHLTRLPEIDGFIIDRLDWAGVHDYAHDDGLSMFADRPAENLALPVAEAVGKVAQMAHAAGKRVFVNQFYRVEVLRDVDGVCHENDYLRAMGYLIPLRPAAAWNMRKPYQGDLLAFESQLKLRLQWALFPQMIAHQFPISQQSPEPRAADFLELYAPLFDTLAGKQQVLAPHCVEATGANDVNLFVNGAGNYVVPVTSRTRFATRKAVAEESVSVRIILPEAGELTWAHALSADGPSYKARLTARGNEARIALDKHGSSTVLVLGKGREPALATYDAARAARLRASIQGKSSASQSVAPVAITEPPAAVSGPLRIRIAGQQIGSAGPLTVLLDGKPVGKLAAGEGRAVLATNAAEALKSPPRVSFLASDEGTWFVPENVEIVAPRAGGGGRRLAAWQSGMALGESTRMRIDLPLAWSVADLLAVTTRFDGADGKSAGRWRNRLGARAVWIPGVTGSDAAQRGYQLAVASGTVYQAPLQQPADPRVLEHPAGAAAGWTCWFADEAVRLRVAPPDAAPYRLTLYVLDHNRNRRAMDVTLSDDFARLDARPVTVQETDGGIYLSWQVTGPVKIELKKTAGFNAVLSGVFVDPAAERTR